MPGCVNSGLERHCVMAGWTLFLLVLWHSWLCSGTPGCFVCFCQGQSERGSMLREPGVSDRVRNGVIPWIIYGIYRSEPAICVVHFGSEKT